ncbi:MAG: MFS transporter [Candidatus Gracilibacteria bacterium]|nr:MFS transporter [Candidatus Gracilibacteria bacterium]
MSEKVEKVGQFNLKIHYFGTFLISFSFLSPVISLYYKFFGLGISDIVFISSIYYFYIFLLEIPTSTFGDNLGRVKTMKYSILAGFFPLLIYLFIPSYEMFFVAIFFSALGQALWNGNAQAKLEDDLNAIGKKADFGKTIGKLISLTQVGKLITPLIIFFVLKYFPNSYSILVSLDLLVWIFVFLVISRFKEIDDSYIRKADGIINSMSLHIDTIMDSFKYMKSTKSIVFLLVSMLFGTDLYLLAKVILPVIVEGGVEDYVSSIVVWFATISGILGSLSSSKIANKLGWQMSFTLLVFLNMILHFMAFYFFEQRFILTVLFICITFVEFAYMPIRNHILMDITPIRAKATIRSLFISVLLLYQFVLLFLLSFVKINVSLLIIGFFMIISIIMSRYIVLNN